MVPLTKPALITIAITSFNGAWNDFGPYLYPKEDRYTLQMVKVFKINRRLNELSMAGTLVLHQQYLFLVAQYFIEGMDLSGGMKG